MTKRWTDHDKVVYQCNTSHFALIGKKGDSPPSYCPNCAINHLKGKLVPVWKSRGSGTEWNEYTKR